MPKFFKLWLNLDVDLDVSAVAASLPRKSQHSAPSYLSPRLPSSSSKRSSSLRVRFPSPSSSLRLSRAWSSGLFSVFKLCLVLAGFSRQSLAVTPVAVYSPSQKLASLGLFGGKIFGSRHRRRLRMFKISSVVMMMLWPLGILGFLIL
ncbi:hypothetical protein PIB30_075678 [Stylosanthes scabra]|uniref:Uncharacterized protein n=1 Tax=Stylosanthes scabra TaxID=79078 RepID=A0ABU6ZNN7_9FABA|nr:hypothetical protein [Stylosanthes scabra]